MSNTLDSIFTPELAEFARLLIDHQFRVYVFKSEIARLDRGGKTSSVSHLCFSRVVDGRECFASVDADRLGGPQFTMPIKPSRKHGSAMFIGDDQAPDFDLLTLTNAATYASPTGYNRLVGTHENDHSGYTHLYVEVTND